MLTSAGVDLCTQRSPERQSTALLDIGRGAGSTLRDAHWRRFIEAFHRGTFALQRHGIEPRPPEGSEPRTLWPHCFVYESQLGVSEIGDVLFLIVCAKWFRHPCTALSFLPARVIKGAFEGPRV